MTTETMNGSSPHTALTSATPATLTPTATGFNVEINAGNDVTLDMSSKTFVTPDELHSEVTATARRLYDHMADEQRQRQAIEDERSIHRNKNRMLTLIFALFASVCITYVLGHNLIGAHYSKMLGPYSFAITILFDSALTIYAYIRRY